METILAVFAKNLKKFRNSAGITQEQLSEYSGLSIGYIARLETAKNWPSEETVKKLSKALNIDEGLLFVPENADELLRNLKFTPSQEQLEKLVNKDTALKILAKAKLPEAELLKIFPPRLALRVLEAYIRLKK